MSQTVAAIAARWPHHVVAIAEAHPACFAPTSNSVVLPREGVVLVGWAARAWWLAAIEDYQAESAELGYC
jgi:hypothetical protein